MSKLVTSKSKLTSIVGAIQKLYPVALADKTWDNTGLLVDSSSTEAITTTTDINILLTIDLTKSVVDEAIKLKTDLILAYHPFIFRGLKAINQVNPQQQSLVRLIQNGISVYCPHTAIDAAIGGVNDWLADGVSDENSVRTIIEPNPDIEGTGMGRLLTLTNEIPITELILKIKKHLNINHLQLAEPEINKKIKTIAICAGSGGSLFKNVEADLYFTGELSHHEALFFKENGNYVISCNHSNTERGFLKILQKQLKNELKNAKIYISETDKDPYKTI
ncbi:hypothetical protein PACTADRAFT_41068 [Pachysolen tannophilus NRRL Y-2460]|uniref:YbgI/family dinuclear metal center protein n=1 Tax=Pachysolen tannophilus NRRL Y-2460 TaxID=669874 RepID=A0A1E4TWL5_PACTA|nr:hypothetical protein PACTADRAFT_41068 [Pachysolen tannophilus NRRL Y-2460]